MSKMEKEALTNMHPSGRYTHMYEPCSNKAYSNPQKATMLRQHRHFPSAVHD